jgi:large subunit ribosomal protein L10
MALSFKDKQAIVAEISEVAKSSISLVVADYRGLSVSQMGALRKKARESGVYLQVVRNTLAKRALEGTDFECIGEALVGPLVYGFAKNEPGAAARLFKGFAKENERLEVKALSLAGQFYGPSHLDAVASLPSRDEARAQLAAMLLAPVTTLARLISEPSAKFARALNALKDQKESQGS